MAPPIKHPKNVQVRDGYFQPRFSIYALTVLTALVCLALFAWTKLRLPSVSKRGHKVIQLHARDGLGAPSWLSKYSGPNFDSYKFHSRKSHQAVVNELNRLRVENYELIKNWYVGNSGYSKYKTYFRNDTRQVLQISVKWVPADRDNIVRFVWHKEQKKGQTRKEVRSQNETDTVKTESQTPE